MLIRTEEQLEAFGESRARRFCASADSQVRRFADRNKQKTSLPVCRSASLPRVYALTGELGSGKTAFVRGFARGLGIRSRVTSPTFVLARRHRIPTRGTGSQIRGFADRDRRKTSLPVCQSAGPPRWFWHLDLYRLRGETDLSGIGFEEILADPRNIVVIEWADRARKAIPKNAIRITFHHHPEGRSVTVRKSERKKFRAH